MTYPYREPAEVSEECGPRWGVTPFARFKIRVLRLFDVVWPEHRLVRQLTRLQRRRIDDCVRWNVELVAQHKQLVQTIESAKQLVESVNSRINGDLAEVAERAREVEDKWR